MGGRESSQITSSQMEKEDKGQDKKIKQSSDRLVLSNKVFFFFIYQLMLKNTDVFYKNSTIVVVVVLYIALLLKIYTGKGGEGSGIIYTCILLGMSVLWEGAFIPAS